MTADDAPDDRTTPSRRSATPAEDALDATVIAARRRSDAPGDRTVVATRRGPAEPVDDETAPSQRAAARGDDTASDVDDTLLRPSAPVPAPAATAPVGGVEGPAVQRTAHVPDAAQLRTPSAPRRMPPPAVAGPIPPRPAPPASRPASADHESVERAVRTRERRRVLIVVLCAVAGAIASVGALLLLLT